MPEKDCQQMGDGFHPVSYTHLDVYKRQVDGLGMLLHQGRLGFSRWFGIMPEVTPELRAAVLVAAP